MKALRLPFTFDPARLRHDLAQVAAEDWTPHFNKAYYEGEWGGASLRSTSGRTQEIYPDPTATGFLDTPLLERTPYFREVLGAFRCEILAARLLVLRAGSRIREHRDYNLSIDDGEFRVHVPVQTNDGVVFVLGGERVVMDEGTSWYLNVNHPHSVENRGEQDRIHLVFDCVVNEAVRRMVARCATEEFLRRAAVTPDLDARLRACPDIDSFVAAAAEGAALTGFAPEPDVLREMVREGRREMLHMLL